MSDWNAWVGRDERRHDKVDRALVGRWLATFDRDASNTGVPQGFHWCLCTPDAPTAQLGTDGHPSRDDSPDSFLPPVALPRRMWASSAIEFLRPIQPDATIERISRITRITSKTGSSGPLLFVDIEHQILADTQPALTEVQSIVYRDAASSSAPGQAILPETKSFDSGSWTLHRRIMPSEPLLFRYSALTFNSHRIHYDRPYAMDEEGYSGLVVHGPLTATLLLDLARRHFGDNVLARFSFRGMAPGICGEPLHLVLREGPEAIELGAFGDDGRQIMAASATTR